MSTRSFIHSSPFVSVILAITLCLILSASAVADRSGQNKGKPEQTKVSERANDKDRNQKNERDSRNQKKELENQTRKNDRDNNRQKVERNDRPDKSNKSKDSRVTIKIGDQNRNYKTHYDYPTYRLVKNDPIHPVYRQARYTHWVFDLRSKPACRKSVYFYFGYFPYVLSTRIHIKPYVSISYCSAPIIIENSYYLDRQRDHELDDTLADIRSAWIDGRSDLISRHVNNNRDIAVLLDGSYNYSIDADDYLDMTSDAVDQMKTISFTWQSVRKRTDGSYAAFAKHTYVDQSGIAQTVYVSYTLYGRLGSYDIVEVGSSKSSLI
jgi:hypothetical protein